MQYSYGVPFSKRQIKGHLLLSILWTYSDSIVVIVMQVEVTIYQQLVYFLKNRLFNCLGDSFSISIESRSINSRV